MSNYSTSNDPYFPNNNSFKNSSYPNQHFIQPEQLNQNQINQILQKDQNDIKRQNTYPNYFDENFNINPEYLNNNNIDNNNIDNNNLNNKNNSTKELFENFNIDEINEIKNYYQKGRINQRGFSHGYNIISNELFNKNSEKQNTKIDYSNQFVNNIINPHFNNITLPPRKIEEMKKENEKNIKNKIECFECSSKEIPITLPTPSSQKPFLNYEESNFPSEEKLNQVSEEERKRFNEYVELLKKREEEYYKNQQQLQFNQNQYNPYYQNNNIENPNYDYQNYQNENYENQNNILLENQNYQKEINNNILNKNIPLFKQLPAGFNLKNHPSIFSNYNNPSMINYQKEQLIQNNDQLKAYYQNKKKNDIGEGVLNMKPLPIKPPKYNDMPLDRNSEKIKRQQQYKEFLDEQINRKKEYEKRIEDLTSQGQKNANIKGNINPYKELREKKERKNLGEVQFNPFTDKNYNIGDKSNLINNPITNPINNYQFVDRRKITSGKLQNNGSNVIG